MNVNNQIFPDVPGSNHDGAGTLSFTDGHVKVRALETRPRVRKVSLSNVTPSTNDWLWLQARATARPAVP